MIDGYILTDCVWLQMWGLAIVVGLAVGGIMSHLKIGPCAPKQQKVPMDGGGIYAEGGPEVASDL